MIIQAILDFFRDVVVTLLSTIASAWPATSVDSTLSSISIPADSIGAVLAVLFLPGGWGLIITLFATYCGLWVTTGLVKVVASRIGH